MNCSNIPLNHNFDSKCGDFKPALFYQSETKQELPISAFLIRDFFGDDITTNCKCFSSPKGLIIEVNNYYRTPFSVTLLNPNEFKP